MSQSTLPEILIATQNKDKFRIVADILEGIGLHNYHYASLIDLQITEEMEESGTTEDRAKQKVLFYRELLDKKRLLQDVAAIVGIDDGILIKKERFHTAESKEITDQILSGRRVGIGDEIVIRRSYFAVNIKTGEEFNHTTDVPFQFLGNPERITRHSGKYPLSYVIGHLDSNITVANNTTESNINYNVFHSQGLLPILKIVR